MEDVEASFVHLPRLERIPPSFHLSSKSCEAKWHLEQLINAY